MNIRSSLYAKLLLWLGLNLALIAGLFILVAGRAGLGWSMLLSEPVRERLLTIGEHIATDLGAVPETSAASVLAGYSAEYGVDFALDMHGPPYEDRGRPPPPHGDFGARPPAPSPPSSSGLERFAPPPPAEDRPEPPRSAEFADRRMRAHLILIRRQDGLDGYEVRIPSMLRRNGAPLQRIAILARTAGLPSLLRLLGVSQWLLFAVLVIVLSALLWWPFIWGITRTIVGLTQATHDIAAGRFDTRVRTRRQDELGRLAAAVNRMAERLQNFVAGQKEFLADVAHEVASPLARMQAGLGVLETRLDSAAMRMLDDVREEVQQMSALLDQLLLFSRAGLQSDPEPPQTLELQALLRKVLEREDPQHLVRLPADAGLRVRGRGMLLERALANLVRNALRYGGEVPGMVEVNTASIGGDVEVAVRDRGPGVPEAALPRLGEPFFRPEAARSRDSGGSGLGLAIVRRCVEACGGEVRFGNRAGGGFEAVLTLPAPDV